MAKKAVIEGEAPLSIEDLLMRPDRTQSEILNAVAKKLVLAARETIRISRGHPQARDQVEYFDRAARLFNDLGRIIERGQQMAAVRRD